MEGCLVLLREGKKEAITLLIPRGDPVKAYRVRETIIALAFERSDEIVLINVDSVRSIAPPIPLIEGALLSENSHDQ